jgi:hypothetical protein
VGGFSIIVDDDENESSPQQCEIDEYGEKASIDMLSGKRTKIV